MRSFIRYYGRSASRRSGPLFLGCISAMLFPTGRVVQDLQAHPRRASVTTCPCSHGCRASEGRAQQPNLALRSMLRTLTNRTGRMPCSTPPTAHHTYPRTISNFLPDRATLPDRWKIIFCRCPLSHLRISTACSTSRLSCRTCKASTYSSHEERETERGRTTPKTMIHVVRSTETHSLDHVSRQLPTAGHSSGQLASAPTVPRRSRPLASIITDGTPMRRQVWIQ